MEWKLKDYKGKSARDLFADVIDRGLCTACGTCVAACPKGCFSMCVEEPLAELEKCNACGICYACCPGEHTEVPALEKLLFGKEKDQQHELLGLYRSRYISRSADENIVATGASAGTAASIQIYALEEGIVDGFIGIGFDEAKPWIPKAVLSTTKEEILATQGSKYTHCSVNDILRDTAKQGMRVGIVGLPCAIQGLRKIQAYLPESPVSKSVVFSIGLFCGENRFTRGAEHIITRRLNVPLEQVKAINYKAGPYPGVFTVWDKQDNTYCIPYPEELTFLWMHTRPRCRICWDYAADVADISLGGTQYTPGIREDGKLKVANNAALVRTEIGEKIFSGALEKGYITARPAEEAWIINHSGLERKKYANLIRIEWVRKHGLPMPDYPAATTCYDKLPDFCFGQQK